MWCFALIDGWREYATQSVPEIALAQWDQLTEALQDASSMVAPNQWVEVRFEDLLERPGPALSGICDSLGIELESAMETRLEELGRRPVNALSGPRKSRHPVYDPEVRALLPRISKRAPGRGYEVDPVTGDCRPIR